ncbi:hypothetical protein [Cognatilysobacter lacus]|uniref:Uncharacterized protein n=1 Tax=Cognatilysobacter lacus TaxID=1643323 RepID=A0A5D8Z102_9GAMM|nr:hypothetical protein [Lysobacter lacus]TZF88337.1 hypothetical protein FW784_10010 [Lysobacter lacus]
MAAKTALEELNACEYLFFAGISEPEENSLRLLVQEGRRAGEPQTLKVGSGSIEGVIPIDVTAQSRTFELYWPLYISYAVRNESYCDWDDDEEWEGAGFRVYSRSKFLDFVANGTFATAEYPGPFRHFEVLCANHIIDVAAQEVPVVRVVGA